MMSNDKIMFLTRSQFGYQTDYWNYVSLLADRGYDVIYTGLHAGRPEVEPGGGCRVFNFRSPSNRILRVIRYCLQIAKIVKEENPDLIFVQFWQGCIIYLPFLFKDRKKMILDIRTGAIGRNRWIVWLNNLLLRVQAVCFTHDSCISNSLMRYLRLPRNTFYLPLGGHLIKRAKLDFSYGLRFLYLGTFSGRNLDRMLSGFASFVKKNNLRRCCLTMAGEGPEREELESLVDRLGMLEFVRFVGYVPRTELKRILLEHNVGISYVPILPYYDFQPPTKTYEYLLSGMPVIATATKENMAAISEINGTLSKDDPESFASACLRLYESIGRYSVENIQNSVLEYDWNHIVDSHLIKIIDRVRAEC